MDGRRDEQWRTRTSHFTLVAGLTECTFEKKIVDLKVIQFVILFLNAKGLIGVCRG